MYNFLCNSIIILGILIQPLNSYSETRATGGVISGIKNTVVQDYEIYQDGELFIARGKITHEQLISGKDASRIIQAAVDALPESGGEVLIHRGEYPIHKQVNLKSRITLRGSGRSTRLMVSIADSEVAGVKLEGLKGTKVTDMELISADENLAFAGIHMKHCGDCEINDLYCEGFPGYGIYVNDRSFLNTIDNCSLASNKKAAVKMEKLSGGGRGGDYVPNLITDCTIYGGGRGIEFVNVLVANIVGCQIYQTEGPAFHFSEWTCSVVISGCRTFQILDDVFVAENSNEMCITGNTFCWQEGHGIVLDSSSWGTITGNMIIDNGSINMFDPARHPFIKYQADPNRQFIDTAIPGKPIPLKHGVVLKNHCKGYTVTGNAIFNWPATPKMGWGIIEDSSCFKNVFVANNINKCEYGDILSEGMESEVHSNISFIEGAYHGDLEWDENPDSLLYQFYDYRLIREFIKE